VFRIYRDIRFSKDKSPYKTHFGAVLTGKEKGLFAGYYLHDIGKRDVGFVAVWLNYRF